MKREAKQQEEGKKGSGGESVAGNCTVYSVGAGGFCTPYGASALVIEVVYIIPSVVGTVAQGRKRCTYSTARRTRLILTICYQS